MSYQVIKLSNGEDIVCKVHENTSSRENSKLKISSPLRMETITRDTSKGVVESLALSRWVQPYSDEEIFNIERNSVVIMTPASVGLSRYYEYVLKGMEQVSIIKPTKKQLDDIEKSIKKEKYIDDIMDSKELEAILDKLSIKRTYH
tara:strand:+ start:163 stop:600 length:438 start_codon:yes stop_codon:yes gene_type:complete